MCKKMFVGLVLAVALVLGVLVVGWPHERMHEIAMITRFFEAMLPVLAVAALIKYIACGRKCDKDKP